MSTPTDNLILLAAEGFKYLRRVAKGPFAGQYVGLPGKSTATHRLHCTRPKPRYDPKHAPRGMIRIVYDEGDPKKAVDYPNTADGRVDAEARLAAWKELALNAAPSSAVAVPRGRAYKNFVQARTEAAKDGSLYDKNKPEKAMAKTKPQPPKKGANKNKDQKNGITRPKEGTVTGRIWDIADKLGADRGAVIKEATKRGINIATITTQYGKWRVYNGMKGRTATATAKKKVAPKKKPTPPKKKAAPAVEAAPAAE